MSDDGFIMLSRGFFAHHLWGDERAFSRAEAWLDMIRMAAFKDRKQFINGSLIEIPRGGIVATERFLSDRWMWSRTKVRAFLEMLEAEKMIRRKKDQSLNVVLLCNFDLYNPDRDNGKTKKEPPKDQRETEIEERKEGEYKPPPARAAPARWFPESLRDEAFQTRWEEWEEHCQELSKPIGASARRGQLVECDRNGRDTAMKALQFSISNNRSYIAWDWQSDTEKRKNGTKTSNRTEADRDRERTGLASSDVGKHLKIL